MTAQWSVTPLARNAPLLVDTNVLIDALRDRLDRRKLLASLAANGYVLTASAINVAEVYAGLRTGEESETQRLLQRFRCIPVTETIAQRAGTLRAGLRRVGRTHTLDDMIVAATALEVDCPLLTENRRDFLIEGLTLFPLP